MKKKIEEITQILVTKTINKIGLLTGIGGQILFCSELFLQNEVTQEWLTNLHNVLEDKLENEGSIFTHCSGLAGIGWLYEYLSQKKIIDYDTKIELPPRGAGKVKEGHFVNVKFDNYPHMEFGMIKVQIAHISLVPINKENQKNYVLEVVFPDSLVTNYGKTLEFSQEMTGSAEIITEDLRLLDRFLNPIRSLIKQ
jgi:hypothetical protein